MRDQIKPLIVAFEQALAEFQEFADTQSTEQLMNTRLDLIEAGVKSVFTQDTDGQFKNFDLESMEFV